MRIKPAPAPIARTPPPATVARRATNIHGARVDAVSAPAKSPAAAAVTAVRRTISARMSDFLRHFVGHHGQRAGAGLRLLGSHAEHAARELVDAGGCRRVGIGGEEGLLAE